MKIIGLEEHFVTRDVFAAWRALDPQWQDVALGAYEEGEPARRLPELGEDRFSAMDDVGVDVQVLSLTAPGLHNLAPADAAALQIATNDLLAEQVRARPDRFQGLATLATPSPAQAACELERAVTSLGLNGGMVFGRVRDRNLDHPASGRSSRRQPRSVPRCTCIRNLLYPPYARPITTASTPPWRLPSPPSGLAGTMRPASSSCG